jgi:hypothetical protein
MSNNNDNRVLCRVGARQLTQNEVEQVAGAGFTRASLTGTNTVSSSDTDMDS